MEQVCRVSCIVARDAAQVLCQEVEGGGWNTKSWVSELS